MGVVFFYDNYHRLNFSRKDAAIIKWMYSTATIYLERKYDSYIKNWHNYCGDI